MSFRFGECSTRRVMLVTLLICGTSASHALAATDPNPAAIHSERGAWPLYRQWNRAEVQHFAKWIENIFEVKTNGTREQRLAKIERVLTDPELNLLLDPAFVGEPSNPQADPASMRAMHGILDCGKLTISLSSYYAYRRGLPWMNSYVQSVDGTDLRTASSTVPMGVASSFDYPSPHAFFVDIVQGFCTGNYRVEPFGKNAELSDTVPVAIQPEYLLPGCVFYLDGHVLVLARVDAYGEPYFLDSTTSRTRDIYAHNGMNAVAGLTPRAPGDGPESFVGCYRGFRMHRFPIAETDANGKVLRVRRRTDAEMREFGYSTEQYDKVREVSQGGAIRENGIEVASFSDFFRYRMRTAKRLNPVATLEQFADEMLALMREREKSVQAAWRDAQANGPITFPDNLRSENIFNAGGRWGDWSSAASDAEFRWRYHNLITEMEALVNWYNTMPDYVDFGDRVVPALWSQSGLAFMLMHIKDRVFLDRTFTYTNSVGAPVRLSLRDVEQRLYDISFDPNHPPELRWGAPLDSAEAHTVIASATPVPDGSLVPMRESYAREAYYRCLAYREPEESYLRGMVTSGFPIRYKYDELLTQRWRLETPPPLVPHVVRQPRAGLTRTARR